MSQIVFNCASSASKVFSFTRWLIVVFEKRRFVRRFDNWQCNFVWSIFKKLDNVCQRLILRTALELRLSRKSVTYTRAIVRILFLNVEKKLKSRESKFRERYIFILRTIIWNKCRFFFFSSNDSLATFCRFHLHLDLLELYVSFVRSLSAHVVQSDFVDRIYHEFRELHVSFVRFLSADDVQNDFVDRILIMNFESCTNHSYLTIIVFIENINIIIVRAKRS